jgi:phospholipid/cholesterol/gamma-HCH transport system substrate-binding protein
MKRNLSDYFIALGVIACSVVLLGALAYALGGRKAKSARTLEIDFIDVTGVRLHSELRYAGAPAGSVSKIRLLTNEERSATATGERWNAVRVTVDIFDGVPDIPSDVVASIASDTLLSEKFIALSAGTPQAEKLANGAQLQGKSSASIDDLLGSVQPLVKSVQAILESIQPVVEKTSETLDSVKDGVDEAMPKIGKVADTAQSALISAQTLLKRADKLIADNEGAVSEDLIEFKNTLTKLQEVLKTTNGMIGNTDKQVTARMKELSVILQNLKVVTTQAKAFTETIGEHPHRLIFGGKARKLTPEQEILRKDKPLPAFR